ncbi:hypothetical protein [Acinetobacter halotolerans]|uniref:hypothetical protein n=1 Tax=Acinetobacter halotolerans TaxID=1752076 RepID=UPI0013EE76CD|nr:hypothetical protein [Acinetobacter halotolerans]
MKRPNRVFAPIIIAGITVGFLASAYKFVFAKSNAEKEQSSSNERKSSSSEGEKTPERR